MYERSPWVRSWRRVSCAVLLAGLTSSCDTRHPIAAPPLEPTAHPRLAVAPGSELGVGSLPVPVDNGRHTINGVSSPYGSLPWTSVSVSIAGPQWVRVRVEGAVSVAANPALAPYFCRPGSMFACLNGPLPLAGAKVGPMGRVSPSNAFWRTELVVLGRIREESLSFNAAAGDAAEALAWVSMDETSIEFSRAGAAGGYQPCFSCSGDGIPFYTFGGDQVVRVTAVAPPVQIVEGVKDDEGRTRFEAQTDYTLVQATWHFYPGDVGPEPNWGHGSYANKQYWESYRVFQDSIRGCTGSASCDYRPSQSGRMYLRAALVGADGSGISNFAVFAGPVVDAQEASLTLACTGDRGQNAVTRGQMIRCEAGKDPGSAAGVVAVTEWSFEGTSRTDGEVTSPSWEGVMVRSGRVQVRGKVGSGREQTATATITVADRAPAAPVFTVRKLADEEDSRLTNPVKVVFADDLGAADFFETPTPDAARDDPVGEVTGGPNHGLYYYKELTFPVFAFYILNTAAMSRGSSFYRAQEDGGGGNRIGGLNWCSRSVVTSSLPGLVEQHELRHIDVYRNAYSREWQAVFAELEPLAGESFSDLVDRYDLRRGELDTRARNESLAIHSMRGNPNVVSPSDPRGPCALKNEDGQELKNEP